MRVSYLYKYTILFGHNQAFRKNFPRKSRKDKRSGRPAKRPEIRFRNRSIFSKYPVRQSHGVPISLTALLEIDRKSRALAQAAFHAQPPARTAADLFDDRKPQPEAAVFAAVRLVHRKKPVENALEILLRDADAGIGDGEAGMPVLPCV